MNTSFTMIARHTQHAARNTFAATLCALLVLYGIPTGAQAAEPDAKAILQKTLAAYTGVKTYQGQWTYTEERGQAKQQMMVEIKAKGGARLSFRIARPPGWKPPPPGIDPIPELRVLLDGKTAYYENTSEKVYFRVPLPESFRWSPEMIFPQIPAASAVRRGEDLQVEGKRVYVLEADTPNGGVTRMEIDAATFRIRGIISESVIAFVKSVSTIAVERETVDVDLPDSAFSFRAAKGAKEIPAPPEAAAMFGPR